MFNKPEELIMAILFAIWVGLTYCAAAYATGASAKYVLLITGFTALWSVASFLLWQAGRVSGLYPVLVGAWVACWWPWLDWFALRGVVATGSDVLVVVKPWYASWWFKLTLSALPIIGGYVYQWRKSQKPRFN